jgi:pSer/pThr/pTyr-binding forkhead associated (FHA) protein
MVAALIPTGPGAQILVDRAVVLIGRSGDCDAVIDFSSKISRLHCVLVQVDTEFYVRDLASMNGIWVNGKRVNKVLKLTQGDQVSIGDVSFQFHANIQLPPRMAVRTNGGGKGITAQVDESTPIVDAEIIEDSDDVDAVEIIEEVELIEDVVEVIDEFELVDDIEVIEDEDDDIIDDVQIITDEIHRPRRPPRLR